LIGFGLALFFRIGIGIIGIYVFDFFVGFIMLNLFFLNLKDNANPNACTNPNLNSNANKTKGYRKIVRFH